VLVRRALEEGAARVGEVAEDMNPAQGLSGGIDHFHLRQVARTVEFEGVPGQTEGIFPRREREGGPRGGFLRREGPAGKGEFLQLPGEGDPPAFQGGEGSGGDVRAEGEGKAGVAGACKGAQADRMKTTMRVNNKRSRDFIFPSEKKALPMIDSAYCNRGWPIG
jgi:hypothetical protein